MVILLVAGALLAVAALVVGMAVRSQETARAQGEAAVLPTCTTLLGTELGPLDEDPAWGGCVTDAGAAVQSYRYQCTDLRRIVPPRGEERVADEAAVVLLPDAGLLAASGEPWLESANPGVAFIRTPVDMLVPYRCGELRSLPHEGMTVARCDLDMTPLDLFTTQGCRGDGEHHPAVGRECRYADGDIGVQWEQWSIGVPGQASDGVPLVLESGPDEVWALAPESHRDERCATPPDEWAHDWTLQG